MVNRAKWRESLIIGTGFVVASQLAVTFAHVIQAARSDRGQPINTSFMLMISTKSICAF